MTDDDMINLVLILALVASFLALWFYAGWQ